MRVLGYLCCLVISNEWVQSCDEHEGFVHNLLNVLCVCFDTGDTFKVEAFRCVAKKGNGVEDVPDDEGFEDVELEVAVAASDGDCCMVAHYLSTAHCHCFALSWIYFSWHD